MYRSRLLAVLLVLSALMFSCSGEDGATGPAGPAGADGNANVTVFQFGSVTTTTGNINYTLLVSQGLIDSSLVLGYYNPSTEAPTAWYPVPGLGSGGSYMTRSMWYQSSTDPSTYLYRVFLLTPSGSATYTASTTFTKFKIILVPASEIIPVTSRGLLDLSDYNAVREYLNLSE
jgi:hypothetical protein